MLWSDAYVVGDRNKWFSGWRNRFFGYKSFTGRSLTMTCADAVLSFVKLQLSTASSWPSFCPPKLTSCNPTRSPASTHTLLCSQDTPSWVLASLPVSLTSCAGASPCLCFSRHISQRLRHPEEDLLLILNHGIYKSKVSQNRFIELWKLHR